MEARETPMIFSDTLTMLRRLLRQDAVLVQYNTVMQLLSMMVTFSTAALLIVRGIY